MCGLRWSAFWQRAIVITLIGLGAASCSDSERFSDFFGPDPYARNQVTGSIQQRAPTPAPIGHIDSQPLPPVASAETQGVSGGGRGMGSYQPASAGSYQTGNAGSYRPANIGGYQSGNAGSYQQSNAGGYQSGNRGSYQPTTAGGYQSGNVGSYQQSNAGGYQSGNRGSYQPTTVGGYQSGNSGSFQQASTGGYQSGNIGPYPRGGASSYQPGHMGSYQPANTEITGTTRPMAPPPVEWTWEGGTPITVVPGETLETIARKHNVPVAAIIQANNMSGSALHPGQRLVIPRYRTPSLAYAPPTTRITTIVPAAPSVAPMVQPRAALPRNAAVHIVEPGETLHSIASRYGKSPLMLARANSMRPNEPMRVGERIVIPDARERERERAEVPPARVTRDFANADSPRSAWRTAPVEQPAEKAPKSAEQIPAKDATPPVKAAEPAGSLPSFRWPARGPVLVGFGPQPNGTQNDGVDVSMPNGTPVKAADDGVITYAGDELQSYGKLVLIRHGTGYVTAYAHANEILVKKGDTVKRGQVIARSGATGSVKEPELHFEIRKGTTPVDPSQFLGN
jgi:murein DD-endopeptidase MepM/ murein hydrolase activator NlpD